MLSLPLVDAIRDPIVVRDDLPRRFMNPGELEALVGLVRSVQPRRVLELGVNEGRTARVLLDNVPSILWYEGVDVLPGYVTSKVVQRQEVPAAPARCVGTDPRFMLILRRRGSLDLQPSDLTPCDAVFIDGDHGRECVLHDSALARALVQPGGIIIWHDYHDLGTVDVRDVLHELAGDGWCISHVRGTWLAYSVV